MKKLGIILLLIKCVFINSEEITVTANRYETDPALVASEIIKITEEDIKEGNYTSVLDVLESVSGLQLKTLSSPATAYITMKGYGENGHARVLILIDGVKVNNPDMAAFNWLTVPLSNIKTIEILKTPGSTVYGDSAVAGVINVITKKKSDTSITTSVFIDSNLRNKESLGVNLGDEKQNLYLNLTRDIYRETRDRTDSDTYDFTTSYNVELTEKLKAAINGHINSNEAQLPGGLTKENYDRNLNMIESYYDNQSVDNLTSSVGINLDYDEANLKWVLPISYYNKKVEADLFSITTNIIHTLDLAPSISKDFYFSDSNLVNIKAGYDFRYDFDDYSRYEASDRNNKNLSADIIKSSNALWTENIININEKTTINSGFRWEIVDYKAEYLLGNAQDDSKVHRNIAGNVGFIYNINKNSRIFTSYHRTYRNPSIDEQVLYQGYEVEGENIDGFVGALNPEKGHNISLGTSYYNKKIHIDLSAYLLFMEGEIMWKDNVNINADDTKHYGFDLSSELDIFDWYVQKISYSYTKAIFTNGDNKNKEIPLVSNHSISLNSDFKIFKNYAIKNELNYNSDYYLNDDQVNEKDKVSSEIQWAMYLNYKQDSFMVYVGVENILDDRTPDYAESYAWYPTPGRRYVLGAEWSY